MAAASPRQVTRNRRTTERLPGQVSTRPRGSDKTPVFTSRKRPSSRGATGGSVAPFLRRRRVERTCLPKLQPSTPNPTAAGADPQRASQETGRVSWRRRGRPHCGHEGAVARAAAATAATLPCRAANICGRYSISTSRSSSKKRGRASAQAGRAGGVSGSGAGRRCWGRDSPSRGVERNGGRGGDAAGGRAPATRRGGPAARRRLP